MAKEAGGDILQDWLKDSPATDLLETDIAEGSFNKRPWCHSVVACDNYEVCSANEKKLVLKDVNQQLSNLKISDTSKLASVSRRTLCSKCKKSRLYFCYTCHIPLDATLDLIPVVQNLPLKVDIIKDVRELDGKVMPLCSVIRSFTNVLFHSVFSYPCQNHMSSRCANFRPRRNP